MEIVRGESWSSFVYLSFIFDGWAYTSSLHCWKARALFCGENKNHGHLWPCCVNHIRYVFFELYRKWQFSSSCYDKVIFCSRFDCILFSPADMLANLQVQMECYLLASSPGWQGCEHFVESTRIIVGIGTVALRQYQVNELKSSLIGFKYVRSRL